MNKIFTLLIFGISFLAPNAHFAATIYSSQSGEWNNSTIWQGGVVPTATDDVVIGIGTSIAISTSGGSYVAVCKSLVINGTLVYSNNRMVIGSPDPFGNPSSGGNATLNVNGTLTIAGDYLNSFFLNGNLVLNSGSTFNMTSGFMHVNGNTGNPLSSVAAGTSLVDVTDATNFNANGGTLFITNPHIDPSTSCFAGKKAFTNNHSVSFGAYITPATTNNFFVDPIVAPTFQTLELNYVSSTVRLEMTDIDIKGAINVNQGTLYNPHLIKTVRVGKDINLGSNGRVLGKIELNGVSQQNINPNIENGAPIASTIIDGDIIVNNPTRVKVKLDLTILGDLILTNGKFDLNDKTVTLRRSPMSPSATSYVVTHDLYQKVGTLKIRDVNFNTIFPVGTEASYAPVFITSSGGDYSVSAHPSTIAVPSEFSKINIEWDITQLTGSGQADILVQWNNIDESNIFTQNRTMCRLYHYNGSNWEPMSNSFGPTTNWGTYFTKLAESVNSFSTFSVFAPSVIPVTLVYFKGKEVNDQALLTWETATELNNKGFDIEKSDDGIHFSSIGFVKGHAQSSTPQYYSFVDGKFTKTAYYRLKQQDFDGSFIYSNTIGLQKEGKKQTFVVYPNPVLNDDFVIDAGFELDRNVVIEVFDMQGKSITKSQMTKGSQNLKITTKDWAKGFYLVRLSSENFVQMQKIIKN
ncbi:MAG: T9SS type A sorting domain-containing protein [Saprospiraceae bacterium]|nr:T9SS type A sorting domain-containing protein [Saprospiraceae bacterium]